MDNDYVLIPDMSFMENVKFSQIPSLPKIEFKINKVRYKAVDLRLVNSYALRVFNLVLQAMAKSIMPFNIKNSCYICKENCDTDTHHIFQGSNRQNADDLGLTVELCRACHKRAHEHPQEFEQRYHLKSNAQKAAMLKHNLSIDEWRTMFRKDYRHD